MVRNNETVDLQGKPFFFDSIGIKLTHKCRLNCSFCCEPNRTIKDFERGNFLRILDTIRKAGTTRLCLTGGDPLLYNSLVPILEHAKTIGFHNILLTSDGELLISQMNKVFPVVDAVRFSVHAIGNLHDRIVGKKGAFFDIELAVKKANEKCMPCLITSVITPLSLGSIPDIISWCLSHNIQQLFIFELLRSGRGNDFKKQYGTVASDEIKRVLQNEIDRCDLGNLKIVHYSYQYNGECVLIYGDGRVVVDPYDGSKSFQLDIGNVLDECPESIFDRYWSDPDMREGYIVHQKMLNSI